MGRTPHVDVVGDASAPRARGRPARSGAASSHRTGDARCRQAPIMRLARRCAQLVRGGVHGTRADRDALRQTAATLRGASGGGRATARPAMCVSGLAACTYWWQTSKRALGTIRTIRGFRRQLSHCVSTSAAKPLRARAFLPVSSSQTADASAWRRQGPRRCATCHIAHGCLRAQLTRPHRERTTHRSPYFIENQAETVITPV